jgi:hypothetical protein
MHLRLSRGFIRRRVLTKFYVYFSFSPCLLKSLHLMILSVLCIFLLSVCLILCFLCIVVPLPPGTNPFVVNNSNSNNNNNNNNNVCCLLIPCYPLFSHLQILSSVLASYYFNVYSLTVRNQISVAHVLHN